MIKYFIKNIVAFVFGFAMAHAALKSFLETSEAMTKAGNDDGALGIPASTDEKDGLNVVMFGHCELYGFQSRDDKFSSLGLHDDETSLVHFNTILGTTKTPLAKSFPSSNDWTCVARARPVFPLLGKLHSLKVRSRSLNSVLRFVNSVAPTITMQASLLLLTMFLIAYVGRVVASLAKVISASIAFCIHVTLKKHLIKILHHDSATNTLASNVLLSLPTEERAVCDLSLWLEFLPLRRHRIDLTNHAVSRPVEMMVASISASDKLARSHLKIVMIKHIQKIAVQGVKFRYRKLKIENDNAVSRIVEREKSGDNRPFGRFQMEASRLGSAEKRVGFGPSQFNVCVLLRRVIQHQKSGDRRPYGLYQIQTMQRSRRIAAAGRRRTLAPRKLALDTSAIQSLLEKTIVHRQSGDERPYGLCKLIEIQRLAKKRVGFGPSQFKVCVLLRRVIEHQKSWQRSELGWHLENWHSRRNLACAN